MKINIRPLVKELLENENLIVSYNEAENGFDLSVRINEEQKTYYDTIKPHYDTIKPLCPHCGSKNVESKYGATELDSSGRLIHSVCFVCKDCQEQFEV